MHARCFADAWKPWAAGKRDRAGAGENLRRVKQKDFIDDIRRQCSPVNQCAAFDDQASDFHFPEFLNDCSDVGPTIERAQLHLLNPNAEIFKFTPLLLLSKRAE